MTEVYLNNVRYTCKHSAHYMEIVDKLRKMEIVPCPTNEKYMQRVKERFEIFYDFALCFNNEENFVKQLIRYGELKGAVNNEI